MKKAIVLLSGGLDSATTLFFAKKCGFKCFCLIFEYGQRHKKEIGLAKKIARRAKAQFRVLKISLPWKGSSLLDKSIDIPLSRGKSRGIPLTYVPGRNTIFLSFALSFAEAVGAGTIFIGANSIDFSGYPDCRPAYYRAFSKLIRLATKSGVTGKAIAIRTPLIRKTKAEIIKLGHRLRVPFEHTWSCYRGESNPCARCESCYFRAKGFKEAGLSDPLISKS
jgi:7-cyano-7-deazaguanine synthase